MKNDHRRLGPQYPGEYSRRPSDGQMPPSPHPTASSGTVYGANQSPMTLGASRMLPSPASLPSVQGNFSPNSNQSAHSSHLADLQHQISTKSLALTTLQREHDQLLTAYSRMQTRCQTLDKKSQVSDHEITALTEDKLRLQAQTESLEAQVEELVHARDDAQKQTTASGAQYMQIVSMSSKLQAQGAEEARRYKADREAWEHDRQGLQKRIHGLESSRTDLHHLPSSPTLPTQTTSTAVDNILASSSLDELRGEVIRLRQLLANMDHQLADLRTESQRLDRVISECEGIKERLDAKAAVTSAALPAVLFPATTIQTTPPPVPTPPAVAVAVLTPPQASEVKETAVALVPSISPASEQMDTSMLVIEATPDPAQNELPIAQPSNTSSEVKPEQLQALAADADSFRPIDVKASGTFLITEGDGDGDDSML